MEGVELDGVWWRAGTLGEQVPGKLTFAPGGPPRLKLTGTFKTLDQAFMMSPGEPIIQGFSTTGKAVTLVGCAEESTNISFPGMMTTTYFAKLLFVGVHFERPEDVVFPVVDMGLTNLADWTLRHGFTLRIETVDKPRSFGLDYSFPATVQGRVGDLEVQLHYGFNTRQNGIEEWTFKQTSYLRLSSATPGPFEEFLNGPVLHIVNLVAFGTGIAVHPTVVRGYLRAPPEGDGVGIFFNTGEVPQAAKLEPLSMLFGLGDLVADFDAVLSNWFRLREMLQPVLDLYFATLYTSMRINNQFLNLAQALESYHRRLHGGSILPKTDFRNVLKAYHKVRKALMKAIPACREPKTAKDMRDKFSHFNDITLSDRLNQLLDEAPAMVVAAAIPDRVQFEKVVRHTRNWHTHYDENSRRHAAEGIDLLNLTDGMRWLLESLLLKQLGLSDAKINELLHRNERLKRVGRWTLA